MNLNSIWGAVDRVIPDEQIGGFFGRLFGAGDTAAMAPAPQAAPQSAPPAPTRQARRPGLIEGVARLPGAFVNSLLTDFEYGGRRADMQEREFEMNERAMAAKIDQARQQAMIRDALLRKWGVIPSEAAGQPVGPLGVPASPEAAAGGPSPAVGGMTPASSGMPSLRQAAPDLVALNLSGMDTTDLVSILSNSAPDIAIGPDGQPYDKRDAAVLDKRFRNPQAVNDYVVDLNDPNNEGRYFPKMPEGATPLFDGQGNVVAIRRVDGVVELAGDRAGAEAGARARATAPYEVIQVDTPDGRKAQVFKDDYRQMSGGGASRASPGGALGMSQAPGDAQYETVRARSAADQMQAFQSAGQQASTKISRLDQIDALLGDFEGGRFTPAGVDIASALNSLGWQMDPKLSNAEAARALSSGLALEFKDMMPGPLSNADRDYLARMAPGLLQSAAGRKQLISLYKSGYQRQAQVAEMARKWEQRYGRIDRADENGRLFDDQLRRWSDANPLIQTR